ncbi:MAG: bifunctional diaminohydroxyphosphoribosylaminopyrimidine deaminase/5-amino-6-(5-phosphoribosylamino)uracil reductase RibD [Candidatus Marinimicrobia bacterium]|nr:bifunctional diaminohydroxyphosphoribosylaminopyrimidine deaminase/5-amino-6-(5-phosphoribosylamino)uracil reductase RibD [Candidatus Neomarinimicrobiota bacterium]
MNEHEILMKKALKLAEKGRGYTSPNPVVGAVIVKKGKIISEGYHDTFGKPHAEVIALQKAGEEAFGATLYVNLEPCCFSGKTPPCTQAIINAGIKKVVVGTIDPNPRVNGKGIKILKENGIEVVVGVLEKESKEINKGFFKYITKKLPYITLKFAMTLDGFIADVSGNSKWISSDKSRILVKTKRKSYDAIMVGIGTVLKDNPELLPAEKDGFIPYRVIIDDLLNIPITARLLNDNFRKRTIIVTKNVAKNKKINELKGRGVKIVISKENDFGWIDLNDALKKLADFGITSIYCEGGSQLAGSLINENLVDEIEIFIAPKIIGKGINFVSGFCKSIDEYIKLKFTNVEKIEEDLHIIGKFN